MTDIIVRRWLTMVAERGGEGWSGWGGIWMRVSDCSYMIAEQFGDR
mgnify:CR=1 FL=1